MSGRYYMEGDTDTDSDKRLTQQAVFECRLQVPSNTLAVGSSLGVFWIEYVIQMTRPTIQTNFVGSSSSFLFSSTLRALDSMVTEGVQEEMLAAGEPIILESNNTGVEFLGDGMLCPVDTTIKLATQIFQVPAGVWLMTSTIGGWNQVTSAAAVQLLLYEVSIDEGVTWNPVASKFNISAPTTFALLATQSTASLTNVDFDYGVRLVVPTANTVSGVRTLVRLATIHDNVVAAATLTSLSITFTRTFPLPDEADQLMTKKLSMSKLSVRLQKLEEMIREQELGVLVDRVERHESKTPLVIPPSSSVRSSSLGPVIRR